MPSRIAVIDIPDLIAPLTNSGFITVTGSNFRETATEILAAATPLPIIAASRPGQTGLAGFLRKRAVAGSKIVMLTAPDTAMTDIPGVASIALPVLLANVVDALGLPHAGLDGISVENDFTVSITIDVAAPSVPVVDRDRAQSAHLSKSTSPTPTGQSEALDPWGAPDTNPWATDASPEATPVLVAAPIPTPTPPPPVDDPWADDSIAEADSIVESEPEIAGPVDVIPTPDIAPIPDAPVAAFDPLFVSPVASVLHHDPAGVSDRMSPVILVQSAKGGVGATIITLTLADIAASGGVRTTVVDGHLGLGGIRKGLRILPSPPVASIPAIASPDQLTVSRGRSLPIVGFAAALTPDGDQTTTASDIASTIEMARSTSDLVIVDLATWDPEIQAEVLDPLLRDAGVWVLAVSDDDPISASQLFARLERFSRAGLTTDRALFVLNDVTAGGFIFAPAVFAAFTQLSVWHGAVLTDLAGVREPWKSGLFPAPDAELREVLTGVLHTISSAVSA